MSNPKDEMSRFVTGVADLEKDECRTSILHSDMIFPRLMVYSQSSEESKLTEITRNLKMSGPTKQNKPRFKKKAPTKDETRYSKVKIEIGSDFQGGKPTCATCGKKHYGKCLISTMIFFGCGKDGHKVRDFPMIAARGKKVSNFHLVFPVMMIQGRIAYMHSGLVDQCRRMKMRLVRNSFSL